MSDLQIITGISILFTGFLQLRCGLSAYHWQVLVNLAWFSSLTHLSCLTFLRNYLYNRPAQRAWRLVAMAAFLIMLLAAFEPTKNYTWSTYYLWPKHYSGSTSYLWSKYDRESTSYLWSNNDSESTYVTNYNTYYYKMTLPSDFAICYFYGYNNPETDNLAFDSTVLSMLLPGFAFMIRIVKLHKYLSVDIAGSVRRTASVWSRKCLSALYNKLILGRSRNPILHRITRRLLYRPLLAMFLTLRVSADTWSSMTVEV